MAEIQDPVFGPLSNEGGYWSGAIHIACLGGEIPLEVEAPDNEPPSDHQRRCFADFLRHCNDTLKIRMETGLYRFAKDRTFASMHDYERESVDSLESAAEIWRTLHDSMINVPVQTSSNLQLSIGWSPDWEEEHGVQVLYRIGGDIRVTICGDDDFDDIEPIE